MLHPLPAPPAYDAGPYNYTLAMEINGQEPLALRSFEGPHADCRPFSMLQLPKMDLILTKNRGWGVKAAAPHSQGRLHRRVRRCHILFRLLLFRSLWPRLATPSLTWQRRPTPVSYWQCTGVQLVARLQSAAG